LFQWDTAARRYFNHFELHKQAAREGLRGLFQNLLTRNRDPIQFEHRFREVDTLSTRQLLGDISQEEVHELNKVVGGPRGLYFTKGWKDPASIFGWNVYSLLALYGVSVSTAVYGRFVRGYNNLWLVAGFVPFWTYVLYNWARQPNQDI
jgi:hypothetical protein